MFIIIVKTYWPRPYLHPQINRSQIVLLRIMSSYYSYQNDDNEMEQFQNGHPFKGDQTSRFRALAFSKLGAGDSLLKKPLNKQKRPPRGRGVSGSVPPVPKGGLPALISNCPPARPASKGEFSLFFGAQIRGHKGGTEAYIFSHPLAGMGIRSRVTELRALPGPCLP